MQTIIELFQWLVAHRYELIAAVAALLSAASVVVKFTPTDKDDKFVAKLVKWLAFVQPKGVVGFKLPLTAAKPRLVVRD